MARRPLRRPCSLGTVDTRGAMRPRAFARRTTALLAAGLLVGGLLAGCGDGPGAVPAPSGPGATAPASIGAPTSVAASTVPPSEGCGEIGGLPGCVTFTSVSGSDPTGPLVWLAADPITFSVMMVDGQVQGGITTPCNSGGGPAALDGGTLTFDRTRLVRSAKACTGPAAQYEAWTFALIGEPVAYTFDGTTLTWSNARGTVAFRRP